MMAEDRKILKELFPELIQLRRRIHSEPEIAWQEYRTTKKITDFLESQGIRHIRRPLETGAVADIIMGEKLPWIGIRADIDALPVLDEKSVDYRSKFDGVCHACGHDVHTAIVCGIGAVLLRGKTGLPVNVRLIFQPAEEPIPSGAPRMMGKGILDNLECAWALHVEPALPLRTLSLTPGWVNAQSVRLHWELEGRAAHSARPRSGINPIPPVTRLIQQIQQISDEKWNDPEYPVILSFTQLHSTGQVYNTTPERVQLVATLRLTDPSKKTAFFHDLHRIHLTLEKESGIKIHFEAVAGAPPVMNNFSVIQKLMKNLTQCPDLAINVENNFRSMGGDDFGWYSETKPAALIRFGISGSEPSAELHTGRFDVPDEVIQLAILFFLCQLRHW